MKGELKVPVTGEMKLYFEIAGGAGPARGKQDRAIKLVITIKIGNRQRASKRRREIGLGERALEPILRP